MGDGQRPLLPLEQMGMDGDFHGELVAQVGHLVVTDMAYRGFGMLCGVAQGHGVYGHGQRGSHGEGVQPLVADAVGGYDHSTQIAAAITVGNTLQGGCHVGALSAETVEDHLIVRIED